MRSMLRRPGNAGVILVCAVAVALLAYFVASAKSTTYTAEALGVVVPSASITPDQANRLAVTYASLIPQDGAIRRRVAAAVETTPADVGRRLGAGNDSETSLLRLRYRGADADTAVAGARSALLSLTGGNPVSTNISPRSVGVVQLPRRATASKNVKSSVVVGVVLGVGLGALLVLALERGDPRVEDADELEDHLGCPVSSFESLSVVGVHALVDRWRTIAGRKAIRVALLPAGQGLDHEVRRVARTLAAAEDDAEPLTLRPGEYPENQLEPRNGSTNGNGTRKGGHRPGGGPRQKQRDRVQLRFVAGHAPGEGSGGEALAMMCDLTVLVIPRRNPAIGDRRDRRCPGELRRSPRLDDPRDPEDDVDGARRPPTTSPRRRRPGTATPSPRHSRHPAVPRPAWRQARCHRDDRRRHLATGPARLVRGVRTRGTSLRSPPAPGLLHRSLRPRRCRRASLPAPAPRRSSSSRSPSRSCAVRRWAPSPWSRSRRPSRDCVPGFPCRVFGSRRR